MHNLTGLTILLFIFNALNAQNYKLNFTGTGESTLVDSVEVQNLTRETFITLPGTDTLLLLSTIGIEEANTGAQDMLIYPNPSSQTARIRFDNSGPGKVEIELREITGKILLEKDFTLPRATHIFTVSGLKTGIYLLQIKTLKETYAERLIVSTVAGGAPEILYEGLFFNEFHPNYYKQTSNLAVMHYEDGERLLFKAHSSQYATVQTLVPDKSQQVTFDFVECTDADSNHYTVVMIGIKTWMAENLAYLPSVVGPGTGSPTTSYYYVYGYDGTSVSAARATANYTTYGVLYNWPAAKNACPTGWHLPSDKDWTKLTTYLDGESVAGGKLKETGASHWISPNTNATNETGFTALPGGIKSGPFYYLGSEGRWWSDTEEFAAHAWSRALFYYGNYVYRSVSWGQFGFSVRCIRD